MGSHFTSAVADGGGRESDSAGENVLVSESETGYPALTVAPAKPWSRPLNQTKQKSTELCCFVLESINYRQSE